METRILLKGKNGDKVYKGWFELPLYMEEMVEDLLPSDLIDEEGKPKIDLFISNYELPFTINIERMEDEMDIERIIGTLTDIMNEVYCKDYLENLLADDYTIDDVVQLSDYLNHATYYDLAHLSQVMDRVKDNLEDEDLIGIKKMLESINGVDEYYIVDGYNNYYSISEGHLEELRDEMLEVFFSLYYLEFSPNNVANM